MPFGQHFPQVRESRIDDIRREMQDVEDDEAEDDQAAHDHRAPAQEALR